MPPFSDKGIPRRLVVSARGSLAVKLKTGVSSVAPGLRLFTYVILRYDSGRCVSSMLNVGFEFSN